jgi:cation transport ATPase
VSRQQKESQTIDAEEDFEGRMTMELSMTIALLAALAIGQFFTALIIAFFVLFAELLEGYTVAGGRRAIEQLINASACHCPTEWSTL